MPPYESPRPTAAELEILNILWRNGPSTVRQVHEELNKRTGYTTILKLLQIMTDKNLVVRDESERSHVYKPRRRRQHVQKRLVRDLLDRAFSGAAERLVQQAIAVRQLTPEQIEEIRQLLDEMEGSSE